MPGWIFLEADLDNNGFFEVLEESKKIIQIQKINKMCQWCGSHCSKVKCENCGGPNPNNG